MFPFLTSSGGSRGVSLVSIHTPFYQNISYVMLVGRPSTRVQHGSLLYRASVASYPGLSQFLMLHAKKQEGLHQLVDFHDVMDVV